MADTMVVLSGNSSQAAIDVALPRNTIEIDGGTCKERPVVNKSLTTSGADEAGNHSVIWRGDDAAGRRIATGTYIDVIEAGDFHQVHKMSLVK